MTSGGATSNAAYSSNSDDTSATSTRYWQLLADDGKLQCALEHARREAERLRDSVVRAHMEGQVHVKCINCPCQLCSLNRQIFKCNSPHGGWKVVALATSKSHLVGIQACGSSVCPISFVSRNVMCRDLTEAEYARKCQARDNLPMSTTPRISEGMTTRSKEIRPVRLEIPLLRVYRENI